MKRTKPNTESPSPEFLNLVSWGCDRQTLSSLIEGAREAKPDPSQLETLGGEQREIRAKLATIRKAAGDIQGLMSTFAGNMATLFNGPPPYPDLPHLIRAFADQFESVALYSGTPDSKGKPSAITQKSEGMPEAILAGYVLFATGSYHDPEVSAVLGKFDSATHRRWRERHEAFVKVFCEKFRESTPKPSNPQKPTSNQ